jgi:hypothetical protein
LLEKRCSSELEKKEWSDEYWFPVPDETKIGSFMFEYRKAIFKSSSGKNLDDYSLDSGHCFCLFGAKNEWSININLLDLLDEEIDELKVDIGLGIDEDLLPLDVSTPFNRLRKSRGLAPELDSLQWGFSHCQVSSLWNCREIPITFTG